jgi:hypothetical protein
MEFAMEKREARRLLEALEDGTLSPEDTRPLAEDADPALLYLIVAWLRARYATHSAAEGVLGRIVAVSRYDAVAKAVKSGERDAITAWFLEEHDLRDLDRDDFIDIVVDKLES